MKKLLLTILGLLLVLPVMARDFTYTYEGQTLTYTVLDEDAKTCQTKAGYESGYWYYAGNNVSGDLIIPSLVKDENDNEFTVTSIGNLAFKDCSGLTSVTIPNSVTSIGMNAFGLCSGLSAVNISDLEAWLKITFNDSLSNPLYYGGHLFLNGNEIKDLVIPNTVTAINNYAFDGCRDLTSVTIPNSVTSIGDYAFSWCSGLTSVTIPNSVTSIGDYAFLGCRGLTSVTIPNSVTSIGDYAFDGCSGLIKSAYPDTLKANPFKGSKNTWLGTAVKYVAEGAIFEDGFIFGPNKSTMYFAPFTLSGDYTIPNFVTSIGDYAFCDCSSLTSVTIPNSVTSIGDSAFASCSGLTSVTIPNSVTSIGDSAFASCSGLTSVTIPNSVRSIGDYAFASCSGLTSVTIPNSVTSIGDRAFWYCTGLTDLKILGPAYCGYGAWWDVNPKTLTVHERCVGVTPIKDFLSVTDVEATQRSASFKVKYDSDKFKVINDNGENSNLRISINEEEFVENGDKVFSIKELLVNQSYPVYANGIEFGTVSTKDVKFQPINQIFADKSNLTAVFDSGDCDIDKVTWSWPEGHQHEGWNVEIPFEGRNTVNVVCQAGYSDYTYDCNYTLVFPNVRIANCSALATSLTSARLSADINYSDGATAYVEWRRNDAPDNVPSQVVECPIVGQKMLGELRGLRDDVYYQFRPYVLRGEQKCYGEWVGFYTGDANVYFAPEVNTMAARVEDSSVTLAGYVLPGTDPVTSRGFEVRSVSASTRAGEEWVRYEATGTLMYCTPDDLAAGTDYVYRVYAETEKETIYGNEQTFSTPAPSAIENIKIDGAEGERLQVVLQRNPVVEHPVVKIISTEQTANVAIFSFDGVLCFKDVVAADGSAQTLDVNLRPGMYLLEAVVAGERKTLRMIVR